LVDTVPDSGKSRRAKAERRGRNKQGPGGRSQRHIQTLPWPGLCDRVGNHFRGGAPQLGGPGPVGVAQRVRLMEQVRDEQVLPLAPCVLLLNPPAIVF